MSRLIRLASTIWACTAMAAPSIAKTERWVTMGGSEPVLHGATGHGTIAYDAGSIKRNGNVRQFTVRIDVGSGASVGWTTARQYFEMDCVQRTFRQLKIVMFRGDGSTLLSADSPSLTMPIEAGTPADRFRMAICPA